MCDYLDFKGMSNYRSLGASFISLDRRRIQLADESLTAGATFVFAKVYQNKKNKDSTFMTYAELNEWPEISECAVG